MTSTSNMRSARPLEWLLPALLSVPLWASAGDLPVFNVPVAQARCYTSSDRFADLCPSADGALVYAATDGGLLEYASDGTFRMKYTRRDGLCGHGVREILPARDGRLWLATTAGACARGAGPWVSYTRQQGLGDDCVYAMAEDRKGVVYAGTERGINRLRGTRFETFDDTHEFGRKPTYGIHSARDGSLWFAKAACLTHYTADHRWETFQRDPFDPDKRSRMTSNSLLCVDTDEQGQPWIGTAVGMGRFDGHAWTSIFYTERFFGGRGPLDNRIVTLACDATGFIWIGYGDARSFDRALGLTRFRGDDWRHFRVGDGIPSDEVHRVRAGATAGVWVATGRGGACLDGTRRLCYRPVSELADNHVAAVRRESDGRVVVQTTTGTAMFRGGEPMNEAVSTKSAAFAASNIPVVDPALRISGIRDLAPRVMLRAGDGRVWLGTRDEGLLCREGARWHRVLLNGQAFPREITCLCEEALGVLWVGTAAEGALRLDMTAAR